VRLSTAGEILRPAGGMPIKRELSIETPDGPIHFSCKHCIDRYNADPSAFHEAVEAQRRCMIAESEPADSKAVRVTKETPGEVAPP